MEIKSPQESNMNFYACIMDNSALLSEERLSTIDAIVESFFLNHKGIPHVP